MLPVFLLIYNNQTCFFSCCYITEFQQNTILLNYI